MAPAATAHDAAILRVGGLVKAYGRTRVVDEVSFDLGPGEVLTLLGPSGCGKSTTLRMIAGLERPDGGEVWVRGRLVATGDGRVLVPPEGRNVGLVFQSYAIWPHMTVGENIAYPLRIRRVDRDVIRAKVAEMARLVKLDALIDRMSTALSGGQQQRVALARALVYEPDLLLLDEPLSNLDTVLRREMRAQIKALQGRLKTSLLYVTHDQQEAMSLSTRVAVMNHGRIEQLAAPGEVYERPATRFVQDFVGETIRLRGVVEPGTEARLRVGAALLAVALDGLAPGAPVEVTMRPEDIVVQSAPRTGNGLAGAVEDVTFYGDRLECQVRIDGADDQTVTVSAGKRQGLAPGARVFLAVDPARMRLWPL
ncbi:MAG: ABC transporter ATP-binding protein [Alphaproteobacteria bacterium]|nr:ABC transporter ATP-binding protein [Alphaproteobacteria bacterium]